MPLAAYRHNAGWIMSRTFLRFTHIGRKTGQPHEAVAMVLGYNQTSREAVICAAWGPETDWFRNLRVSPAVNLQLGRESFSPEQRFLTEGQAFEVIVQFRRQHPHRLRLLSTVLGWGDLRDDDEARAFISTHPFVAFHPVARQSG